MEKKTNKQLENEAYELIFKEANEVVFGKRLKGVVTERQEQFEIDTKGIHISRVVRKEFRRLLDEYRLAMEDAHSKLVSLNGSGWYNKADKRWHMKLSGPQTEKAKMSGLLLKAANSNIALYNYEAGMSNLTQPDMAKDALARDQRKEKAKVIGTQVGGVALLVGGAALATTAAIGIKNAIANSGTTDEIDRQATSGGSKMVQQVSAKDMAKIQQSQQGWTIDGAVGAGQQIQQTDVTEVHDQTDVQMKSQRRVRQPQPKTTVVVDDVTIEDIQQQVEQHQTEYQQIIRPAQPAQIVVPPPQVVVPPAQVVTPPAQVVTPPAQVVMPPAPVVQSDVVGAIRDVGVAGFNAWGARGSRTVVDNSVRNITITKDSGNTYTHIHDNGNDYSDRSVRIHKDSHNRTTVDASRRTYAPTTTTIDASRRTFSSQTTVVRPTRVQRVQQPQVQRTQRQVQPVQQVCTPTARTSSAVVVRTARPSSSSQMQMRMSGQRTSSTPTIRVPKTQSTPTIRVNQTRTVPKTWNLPSGRTGRTVPSGGRGGSPMRRGR